MGVILGLGSLVWGFPGTYGLVGLMPAVIIGGTVTHMVNARDKLVEFRPGVVAIAAILGSLGLIATGGFYKAAGTPAVKSIQSSVETKIPAEEVFTYLQNPINLSRWNGFYQDVDRVGSANGGVGSTYNVSLKFDNQMVPAKMTVLKTDSPTSYAWSLDFGPQANIQDFVETMDVARTSDRTVIHHRTEYRVESVVVRMLNNFVIGDMFESLSRQSLDHLIKEFDG
jgi:hypothetical protein